MKDGAGDFASVVMPKTVSLQEGQWYPVSLREDRWQTVSLREDRWQTDSKLLERGPAVNCTLERGKMTDIISAGALYCSAITGQIYYPSLQLL